MPEPQYVTIRKSARYFLSGPADGEYRSVCFALHGYGQLAEYFIRPFTSTELKGVLFVAPEGFHRFYLNGTSGRVGASWMTKEDRLRDIDDYCQYLDMVYNLFADVVSRVGHCGVLGFSQGVATACRWLTSSLQQFDYLISYAGAFPPDLDFDLALERMDKLKVALLKGDEDQYISDENFQEHLKQLSARGFVVNAKSFEGSHKIYPAVVEEVFKDFKIL